MPAVYLCGKSFNYYDYFVHKLTCVFREENVVQIYSTNKLFEFCSEILTLLSCVQIERKRKFSSGFAVYSLILFCLSFDLFRFR